jgi:HEAT repeat protein
MVPGSDWFWECDLSQRRSFEGPIEGDPNATWTTMGAGAIPYLQDALSDPHARVQRRACKVLGRLDSALAGGALPRLRGLIADVDPTVGVAAAEAVLAIGGPADPAAEMARARIVRGEDE